MPEAPRSQRFAPIGRSLEIAAHNAKAAGGIEDGSSGDPAPWIVDAGRPGRYWQSGPGVGRPVQIQKPNDRIFGDSAVQVTPMEVNEVLGGVVAHHRVGARWRRVDLLHLRPGPSRRIEQPKVIEMRTRIIAEPAEQH